MRDTHSCSLVFFYIAMEQCTWPCLLVFSNLLAVRKLTGRGRLVPERELSEYVVDCVLVYEVVSE